MILVVSGIRDLHLDSYVDVANAMQGLCEEATEMRFGGALGVDTCALHAVLEHGTKAVTRVFVPYTLAEQPAETARVARRADEVIELWLPRTHASYLRRNDVMLEDGDGATHLYAFTDGRMDGGTAYTIRQARKLHVPWIVEVPVRGSRAR